MGVRMAGCRCTAARPSCQGAQWSWLVKEASTGSIQAYKWLWESWLLVCTPLGVVSSVCLVWILTCPQPQRLGLGALVGILGFARGGKRASEERLGNWQLKI